MVKKIITAHTLDFDGFVAFPGDNFYVTRDTLTLFDDDECELIIDQLHTIFDPESWAFEIKDVR